MRQQASTTQTRRLELHAYGAYLRETTDDVVGRLLRRVREEQVVHVLLGDGSELEQCLATPE